MEKIFFLLVIFKRFSSNFFRLNRVYPRKNMDKPPRGYATEIVDKQPIDKKFICGFCQLIVRKAEQLPCGHRACLDCITYHLNKTYVMCALCIGYTVRLRLQRVHISHVTHVLLNFFCLAHMVISDNCTLNLQSNFFLPRGI